MGGYVYTYAHRYLIIPGSWGSRDLLYHHFAVR